MHAEKVSWSLSGNAVYSCSVSSSAKGKSILKLTTGEQHYQFLLPFSDDASVENLVHSMVLLAELGIGFPRIDQLLQNIEPVEMRLETLKGIHDSTLVNDVYNSDLTGLGVALDILMQQRRHKKKIVILSDLFQSGLKDEDLYTEVAAMLKFKGVHQIYGVGGILLVSKTSFPRERAFLGYGIIFT